MTSLAPTTPSAAPLSSATRLGPAHLVVTDLGRSLAFYEGSLGLAVHRREPGAAALGAGGDDLLVLEELPGARRAGRHAGLYHVALLQPSRLELARAAQRLAVTRTPIDGASDHGISEAIYLPDPDGNGIELAADRERARWPELSQTVAAYRPQPLDTQGLLALVADQPVEERADAGLVVGHVHLHVSVLDRDVAFYTDVIGFDVMMRVSGAAFVSAGGYHHHAGLNTWRGEGVPGVPAGTIGLRHWTLRLVPEDVEAVLARAAAAGAPVEQAADGPLLRDPAGNAVVLAPLAS
ncbi:MAG: VOC family protein [Thermoleophilia bacterium]